MMGGALDRKDAAPRRISRPFVMQTKATASGCIKGLASVFNEVDMHGDIVRPGAFAKSLAAHAKSGTRPVMLWAHDERMPIGHWTEVRETQEGLEVELRIPFNASQYEETCARIGKSVGLSGRYAVLSRTAMLEACAG